MAESSIAHKVLPILLVAGALGGAVLAARVTGEFAAALVPLAFAAAVAVSSWAAAGRVLPGRLALGVVQVAAGLALGGALFVHGGRDPLATVSGFLLVVPALVLMLTRPVDTTPRPATAYAPVVAAGLAALLLAVRFIAESGDAGSLLFGGLYLLVAVLLAASGGAEGPARFAVGALAAAVSVGLLYFLAISGAGGLPVLLAALFTASAVAGIGPVGKPRSAEPADDDRPVR
ncbi:hypothetical protein ACTG9Q_04490 [Actinokineospora sp. 24-640]